MHIHFADGGVLRVANCSGELDVTFAPADQTASAGSSTQPTARQLDYLGFIARYIAHFGRSPAESDTQRHFFVSAPSVNQMMRTLERRGFITREAGVARSIRLCVKLPEGLGR